jgi:hypothetical protein
MQEGKPLVLNSVKKAEQKILNSPSENKVTRFDSPSMISSNILVLFCQAQPMPPVDGWFS